MSVRTLPYPARLVEQLHWTLPGDGHYQKHPSVKVTPRTADGRRSAVWCADFYEVQAFYSASGRESLPRLEDALKALPAVYRTTQVTWAPGKDRTRTEDRDWPVGSTRRDRMLRPSVFALMRDPDEAGTSQ